MNGARRVRARIRVAQGGVRCVRYKALILLGWRRMFWGLATHRKRDASRGVSGGGGGPKLRIFSGIGVGYWIDDGSRMDSFAIVLLDI